MTTKAGVGFSKNPDPRVAAQEAARAALASAKLEQADLAFAYTNARHDAHAFHAGLRSVLGTAKIVGGGSRGIVTSSAVSTYGYGCEVAVLSSDRIKFHNFIETGLQNGEAAVGAKLGEDISGSGLDPEQSTCILMFDAIRSDPVEGRPQMNLGSRLLAGLAPKLAKWPRVVGVGLLPIETPPFQVYHQFLNDRVEQNSALAAVFSGGHRAHVDMTHGCYPTSSPFTITKAEGNLVFELDGEPAVKKISDLLGPGVQVEEHAQLVTLGRNLGDEFDESEENFVNRPIAGILKGAGALAMMEADLEPGMQVQLMRRKVDFANLASRWTRFYDDVSAKHGKPFFGFYINCAGRAAAVMQTDREDAEVLRTVLGERVPLLGVYSSCEVARLKGELRSLAWTGVLTLFTEAN